MTYAMLEGRPVVILSPLVAYWLIDSVVRLHPADVTQAGLVHQGDFEVLLEALGHGERGIFFFFFFFFFFFSAISAYRPAH